MMITLNQIIRSRAGFVTAAAALILNLSLAHAVPFNPNVVITGSNAFDMNESFNASGGFSMVSGGTTTNSSYSYNTVTELSEVTGGGNPLAGALTDTGDGFGFNGTASATDDAFLIGFDTSINIINNSSFMQTVVFRLTFSNMVNADDPAGYDPDDLDNDFTEAYARSNLFLSDDIINDDIFFSDLTSDTNPSNGDLIGDVAIDPPSFGASLAENGDLLFTYIMNPSDEVNLLLSWALEGEDLAGGLAEGNLNAFLSVDRVVPVPGALWLMLSGMLVLIRVARK
ncbi:MAG: hypothetical protein WBN96_14385 [Gammaproteobacteria bacterium]